MHGTGTERAAFIDVTMAVMVSDQALEEQGEKCEVVKRQVLVNRSGLLM